MEPKPKPGHFERYNALFERGWSAVLTKVEMLTYLGYLKHADKNGLAYPRLSTIARYVGHEGVKHVQQARARLERWGLLTRVDKGGGSDVARVRVEVPPRELPAELVAGASPGFRPLPELEGTPAADSAGGPPADPAETLPSESADHTIKKNSPQTAQEQPIKQTRRASRGVEAEIPESLSTGDFPSAWDAWRQHRSEKRKPLTPTTAKAQLDLCEKLGPAVAAEKLRVATCSGWTRFHFDDNDTIQQERSRKPNGHALHEGLTL